MHRQPFAVSCVLCLSLIAAVACGGGRAAPAKSAPARATRAAPAPQVGRVPDANTAAILLTSHNAVLAAARLAAGRAQSRDVKLFSRSLVTDHTALNAALMRLLGLLDISPRDDEVSRLLRDQGAARRDTLRELSGWPFDSTYVETEVRFHEDLLVAIDRVFLPSVRNTQLKDYVTTMRPTIAAHLSLAQQVREALAATR